MRYAYGQAVTLCSRAVSGTDNQGNDVWSESQTLFYGCAVWPTASGEVQQGQDVVTDGQMVTFPTGTVVLATDQVLIGTTRFDVVGDPINYQSPFTGWNPGVVVKVKRVTG